MIARLNDELQHALAQRGDAPLEVLDPRTERLYVLISREQYDRLRDLFDAEPLSLDEQRELLRQAGRRAGWDDPEMDAYDRYDEHLLEQS